MKYQIRETGSEFGFAGSKATEDAARIAASSGYQELSLVMRSTKPGIAAKLQRQAGYAKDWSDIVRAVRGPGTMFLQHPFHYPQATREKSLRVLKERGILFICLVHDVEELRGYRFSDYYRQEFDFMLEIADILIVHNEAMKTFFLEKGVDGRRLVVLGTFDYLQYGGEAAMHSDRPKPVQASGLCEYQTRVQAAASPEHQMPIQAAGFSKHQTPGNDTIPSISDARCAVPPASFDRRVIIAGNLETRKSAYLLGLEKISGVEFTLYGNLTDPRIADYKNVSYGSVFPADRAYVTLKNGIGLVWDGDSAETCSGSAGSYLKYNSPHKLSLYLSCGLPAAVWQGSAQADFVMRSGAGFLIDSLHDLSDIVPSLTEDAYLKMSARAARIGARLRAGAYLSEALAEAENRLAGAASYGPPSDGPVRQTRTHET